MTGAEFLPCRLIRRFGSTPSLGIFDLPFGTVEEVLREGVRLSEGPEDFEENFTAVRWLDEPVCGRDYETVPDDVVALIKKVVLS